MIQPEFRYTNIVLAAPTTTVIATGSGLLHSITVNKPLASGVITVYDNTAGSGTTIATITKPGTLLSDSIASAIYDIRFSTGLTIVTSGAAQDITISWQQ